MTRPNFEGSDSDQKLLADLKARAAVDSAYRKRLLTNPHQAIAELAGSPPPKELRIRFIEKPADVDVLAVLPDLVPQDQLGAAELEAVAGGCAVSCDHSCGDEGSGVTCGVTCGISQCIMSNS
jgi:hypothetical protein